MRAARVVAADGHADFHGRDKDRPDVAGRTVWSVFPDKSDYFLGPLMINYRMANLERMLEQLRAGGKAIEKVEDLDYGQFGWITNSEGNRVELW